MREEGVGVKSYTIEELKTMLDDEEKRLAEEFIHSRS
jgi:hypothetical protein